MNSSQVAAITPSFKAVANADATGGGVDLPLPPTSFTYKAAYSTATTRGTVKYQPGATVPGTPGPVQTASFRGAGRKAVTGETVKTETAGSGWAEVKMIGPVTVTSQKRHLQALRIKPGVVLQPDRRVGVRPGALGHRHLRDDAAEPYRHRLDHGRQGRDGHGNTGRSPTARIPRLRP